MVNYVSPWNLIRSMKSIDDWGAVVNSNIGGATRVGYKQFDIAFGGGATNILKPPGLTGEAKQIAEDYIKVQNSRIDFSQGSISKTKSWTDTAVQGEGFFMTSKVKQNAVIPDDIQYTRDGEWHLDDKGFLRTKEGLYVLDGSSIPGDPFPSVNSTPPWAGSVFNSWTNREKMAVRNNKTHDLTKDTVVQLNIDTSTPNASGLIKSNLDDLRIGYYNTLNTWVDVPREIVGPSPYSPSPSTNVRFRLQEDLPAGATAYNKYFVFYGNPAAVAPTYPGFTTGEKTIGDVDPTADIPDNFAGSFNPSLDPILDPVRSVEDFLNVSDPVLTGTQTWRTGLQSSPSPTWLGVRAGTIDYTKDGKTGYSINGINLNDPVTGNSNYATIQPTLVYREADSSKPGPPIAQFKFVDQTGAEIMMTTTIKGTNFLQANGSQTDPYYDFTLSSADLNGSGSGLDPTKTKYTKFKPTQVPIGTPGSFTSIDPVTNLPVAYTYTPEDDGIGPAANNQGSWNGIPYQDLGSVIAGNTAGATNTVWEGTSVNNDNQYLLVKQDINISTQGAIRDQTIDLTGYIDQDLDIYLRKPDGSKIAVYQDGKLNGNVFGGGADPARFNPYTLGLSNGAYTLEVYAANGVSSITTPITFAGGGANGGSVGYVNGTGYSVPGAPQALFLKLDGWDSVLNKPKYKVVDAAGVEPVMDVLTNVTAETKVFDEFGNRVSSGGGALGTVQPNQEYTPGGVSTGWVNRNTVSISSSDGSGINSQVNSKTYWNDRTDTFKTGGFTGKRGGGEISVSNTLGFGQSVLHGPTESINITGTVYADDGTTINITPNTSVAGISFAASGIPNPAGWTLDGYGDGRLNRTPSLSSDPGVYTNPVVVPPTNAATSDTDGNWTRIFSVGNRLQNNGASVVQGGVTATALNVNVSANSFTQNSTILVTSIDGDGGTAIDDPLYRINYGLSYTPPTILAPTSAANMTATGWQPMASDGANPAAPWGMGDASKTGISRQMYATFDAVKNFNYAGPVTGSETISVGADNDSIVYVNGTLVTDNRGNGNWTTPTSVNIGPYLTTGQNTIVVRYSNAGTPGVLNSGGPEGIQVTTGGGWSGGTNVNSSSTWAVRYSGNTLTFPSPLMSAAQLASTVAVPGNPLPNSWAGGFTGGVGFEIGNNSPGSGGGANAPLTIKARTFAKTTTPINRYTVDTATGNIIDHFGDGTTSGAPFYNATSQLSGTYGYDYVPDQNSNFVVAQAPSSSSGGGGGTTSRKAGLKISTGDSGLNGIQSIDSYEVNIPRYYTDGVTVFDRFGTGKQNGPGDNSVKTAVIGTNTDNQYMTSNSDGTLGDNNDQGLIDYDPGLPFPVDALLNVPVRDITRLVQYNPVPGGETRIQVDPTGINTPGGPGDDGIQYLGASTWNEYYANVDFGLGSTGTGFSGDNMIYLRHADANNWIRTRYTESTSLGGVRTQSLILEKSVNGAITSPLATVPNYNIADPVSAGGSLRIEVEGRNYRVYDNKTGGNAPIISYVDNTNPLLYGGLALGSTRETWYDNLQISQLPLLKVLALGDGAIAPQSAKDIRDALKLIMFPANQGLRYDREYGGTYFEETTESGKPKAEIPGQNGAGDIESYSLEASNVNMAQQVTSLASSKSVFDVLSKQLVVYLSNVDSVLGLFR